LSIPSTLAPDTTETSLYVTIEQTADIGTSEAPGGQEPPDNPKPSSDTVPGVQIETDILLLIPETVLEGAPASPDEFLPSRRPENRARSLDDTEYYDEEDVPDNGDQEAAETVVFKPLFRYRKHNNRRRVDKHDVLSPSRRIDPYRRVPFKYCPPCRYYFF
jgi:hypothetical protein